MSDRPLPTRRPGARVLSGASSRRPTLLSRLAHREDGQSIILLAVALVAVFAFASFAIDVARVLVVQRQLQAAADAAVLAASQNLDGTSAGITDAQNAAVAYGAGPGGKNEISGQTVTPTISLRCVSGFGQTDPPCTADDTKDNAIAVSYKTSVPLLFGGVIGWNSMTVSASSTALASGGSPPLAVMLVLDTTGSMDQGCGASVPGISNPTKLQCAKAGAQALLKLLQANYDYVGLAIFPGVDQQTLSGGHELDCIPRNSHIVPYDNPNPNYTIVPPTSDFLTSDGSLNTSSDLVKALDYNGNCGLEAPGGVGTYFAGALQDAQNALTSFQASQSKTYQDVIVFLSDGEANRPGPLGTEGYRQPCQYAVDLATGFRSNTTFGTPGTWIYGVGYWTNLTNDAQTLCTYQSGTENPHIDGYTTVQSIAGSPSSEYFYPNTTASDLTITFQQIGKDIIKSRLIPSS